MRYYKIVNGDYLLAVGTGNGGEEITEAEYDNIMEVIRSSPIAPEGYGYRLKSDLTRELYELQVMAEETDPELTAEEAIDIIVGGGANA